VRRRSLTHRKPELQVTLVALQEHDRYPETTGGAIIDVMNTSAHPNQTHDSGANGLRAKGFILLRRGMAGAALATAITATAVGCAPASNADTAQLQSLIPAPASTRLTDGPTAISNNGIHLHFLVDGPATTVLDAYKSALEAKGWTVTVANSGGWGGYGGATYTGTRGDNYGVFTGGGSGSAADINACAWPSKPSNTSCGDGNRR
jgi:hypothetical protein